RVIRDGRTDDSHSRTRYHARGTNEHRGFAQSLTAQDASWRNARDISIAHGIEHLMREIFRVSVAELRLNQQMPAATNRHRRHGRERFEFRQSWFVTSCASTVGSTAFNPREDDPEIFRIFLQTLTASMRNSHGGLRQEQAGLGICDNDARNSFA